MNTLVVDQVRQEADGVRSFRLQHPDGEHLEPWTPGAHLEVALPSGLIRHYSLCGDPEDRTGYTVAVLEQPAGRGGSTEFHRSVRPGTTLRVSAPRNHFPLVAADRYLFLAGGIGITPILPMTRAVSKAGKAFRVVYGGRSRASMAYRDEICGYGPAVALVPEDEAGRIDIVAELAGCPAGTLVYCCGPEPLLQAVGAAVAAQGHHLGGLHVERFGPSARAGGTGAGGAFRVELARAGVTLTVDDGSSILDKVLEVVPGYPWACREGYCGTCETKIISGQPEHADDILDERERAANDVMMICVGRSRSPRLVLDI